MPYKEHKVSRVYYSIGEVIKVVNTRLGLKGKRALKKSTLMSYESRYSKLRASKISSNGWRRYTQANVESIARFVYVLRTGYFTPKGVVAIMAGSIGVTIQDQKEK